MLVNEAKKNCKVIFENTPELTPMLWGAPGLGKSSIIKAIAQELGWKFLDIRLALLNPVDLRGIPFPNHETGRADWMPASFLPDESRDGKHGIMMLDELSSASESIQVAAYQLILDRKCGDYIVPDGWCMVAAGNRMSDRGVVHRMSSALANRILHFDILPDLDDWKVWAYKNGIDQSILSFLSWKPQLLHSLPEASAEIKQFPTPRTWEFVSKLVKIKSSDTYPLIVSAVGEGPAIEYKNFVAIESQLPDINAIITTGKNPANGKIKEPGLKYAICGALVGNMLMRFNQKKLDMKHVDNLFAYLDSAMTAEMQTMCLLDISKTDMKDTLTGHARYADWLMDNVNILL